MKSRSFAEVYTRMNRCVMIAVVSLVFVGVIFTAANKAAFGEGPDFSNAFVQNLTDQVTNQKTYPQAKVTIILSHALKSQTDQDHYFDGISLGSEEPYIHEDDIGHLGDALVDSGVRSLKNSDTDSARRSFINAIDICQVAIRVRPTTYQQWSKWGTVPFAESDLVFAAAPTLRVVDLLARSLKDVQKGDAGKHLILTKTFDSARTCFVIWRRWQKTKQPMNDFVLLDMERSLQDMRQAISQEITSSPQH